ncbi:DNA (cytosine-5-)-methyltransferase [Clostridium perfringens]|uniref:DNA (cytosine-5-)-methyltransferase n=1 Tax=Clostridium perfringens TaxID=1502 RepID=UPI003748C99A
MNNFIEIHSGFVKIREATKQGFATARGGDSINLEQPNSKTRRGRVGKQIANTLTCSCNQGVVENKRRDKNMWKNGLEKFDFKMDELKLFDSFAGKGALHKALKKLGIPTKVIGLSEIEPDAIIAYAGVHIKDFANLDFDYPLDDEMRNELMSINVGWDFTKQKSSIPRMKKEKLKLLYKSNKLTNNFGDISILDYPNLPDFDLFNFSFPCFIAGTLVLTNKGYKKIEDINEEDYVLTHTNTYQKVVKPMINKADHIYRLKTMCSEDLLVTKEHPFYVRKKYKKWNNDSRTYERMFEEPTWVKTKDLSKDYYIGIAINQNSLLPKWNGCTVNSTYAKRGHKKKLNNIKKYFNNKDFWWVVGRYIGDGWVRNCIDKSGTDIYDLYICCAKNELREITNVLDKLGNDFSYKYYEDKSTYKIRIANVEFAKYLQQFGKGAKNKHLTEDIFDLPRDLLQSFVIGYLSADGCITNGIEKCTSVSKELIYGIGECIAKVYKRPYSIYKNKPRRKKHYIEGRLIKQGTSYSLHFKKEYSKQDKAFYDDGYIWCPINDINKEEYNGFVYNMEVENDNSYTANNIIVHNCTDISNAGKQKGLKNEDGTHTRSGLVKFGIDLIKVKKPKYIMIENVKALIQKKFINDFYGIIDEIESYGYTCFYPTKEDKKGNISPTCLNAKDYGIPQNRERIFVICVRNDINLEFEFPKGFDKGIRLKDLLEDNVDEKYYLSEEIQNRFKLNGKEDLNHNELNVVGSSAPECRTIGQRDMTYGINGIMSTLTATDYKQPKQIIDNTNKVERLGGIFDKNGKIHQAGSIYNRDCLSPTITTCEGGYRQPIGKLECEGWHDIETRVHSYSGIAPTMETRNRSKWLDEKNLKIRKLTPLECWRLMGFDDEDFYHTKELGLSDSSLYKLAGNSIVVNCLYYIFKEVFKEYIINKEENNTYIKTA